MNKTTKRTLLAIGVLLVLNGVLNIMEEGRVLTYDIASTLSGAGFLVISLTKKDNKEIK